MPKITRWMLLLIACAAPRAELRPATDRNFGERPKPALDRRHAVWVDRGAALGNFLLKLSTLRWHHRKLGVGSSLTSR
jgi:hypothetical protein